MGQQFPSDDFPSSYSQVVDGHYYYLREDGSGNYTVYRDKGKKAASFSIPGGCRVKNFVKSGDRFYAFLEGPYTEEMKNTLVSIDEKTGEVTVVKDMKTYGVWRLSRASIYHDMLFYREESIKASLSTMVCMAGTYLNEEPEKKYFSPSSHLADAEEGTESFELLSAIDGKLYYGGVQGKTVTLYSYDLETDEEKELLSFQSSVSREAWGWRYVKIDKDYIYFADYIIPRSGGKITRAGAGGFSFNGQYIFYLDEKRKVHRLSRDLKEDAVVCGDIDAVKVDCTENGIYVQEYKKTMDLDLYDQIDQITQAEKWYCRSNSLYYMDFDGKDRKRLWKERD